MSESKHVENCKHANGKDMHCKSIEIGGDRMQNAKEDDMFTMGAAPTMREDF
jgi:hypothetical protein